MGLPIDGAAGRSDGRTARGLYGVNLEEMKSPKQMLWATALWEEVFFPEHVPHLANNGQARAKGLAEGANFGQCCCVWAWKLVHDIPRVGHEVGRSSSFAVKAVLLLSFVAVILYGGN
jgi:hypothetical protein